MTLDTKEDLRIRMLDLENKLAESEEERSKLEKTCNALIKALREEEKMRYNVLNKKYEKFLQDCTIRKRRNDIILRSLCRIEDRSRALFAKTERLKLLKDRYISYLKINDSKKDEVSSALAFPFLASSQSGNNEVSFKPIQWKTPLMKEHEMKKFEEKLFVSHKNTDLISKNVISTMIPSKPEMYIKKNSEEVRDNEEEKNSEGILLNKTYYNEVPVITSSIKDKLNLNKTKLVLNESLENPTSVQLKNEELGKINKYKKSENNGSPNFDVKNLSEPLGSVMSHQSHQESIGKLKNVFSLEEQYFDIEKCDKRQDAYIEKIVGKDESHEKDSTTNQNKSDVMSSEMNHTLATFCSKVTTQYQGKFELQDENVDKERKPHQILSGDSLPKPQKNAKSPPMGLDGIDYQDETYPESYYEQPVHHHNRTSIVADVILEEDETEPDGEEEEKNHIAESNFGQAQFFQERSPKSSIWELKSGCGTCKEPNSEGLENENADLPGENVFEPCDEIKSQKLDSEKSSEQSDATTTKSGKSGSFAVEKSDKSKPPMKSNLLHLLESDSESFQIEHGDVFSENEGSDFDFSVH